MSGPSGFDHESFIAGLTRGPGVYQFHDRAGKVMYIGKAANLRNRVRSYFRGTASNARMLAMLNRVAGIEVTLTRNETEALLLEQSLIKKLRPPFNIQLRDDKSYPYIELSDHPDYPRLSFYRGSRRGKGRYFGPYPSAHSTRDTLSVLQKVFQVRQCEDSFFSNRSRPCLQYQLERCTAPCTGLVSKQDYAAQTRYSELFLRGKSDELFGALNQDMERAAERERFEQAAVIRDRIGALRRIQARQFVMGQGGDIDVVTAVLEQPYACVHVVHVRAGRVIDSRSHFPKFRLAQSPADVVAAFIAQRYLSDGEAALVPEELIVPQLPEDAARIEAALSHVAERKVRLACRVRGQRAKWLELANVNAQHALASLLGSKRNIRNRLLDLQKALRMDKTPARLECFDVSHTSGKETVAASVAFDENGPAKQDYRHFNIQLENAGDDYAAMEQVLQRRFARLLAGQGRLPDLVLIDGGTGQLERADRVLHELGLATLPLLAIAKGISRRAGQETLFYRFGEASREVALDSVSPCLFIHI